MDIHFHEHTSSSLYVHFPQRTKTYHYPKDIHFHERTSSSLNVHFPLCTYSRFCSKDILFREHTSDSMCPFSAAHILTIWSKDTYFCVPMPNILNYLHAKWLAQYFRPTDALYGKLAAYSPSDHISRKWCMFSYTQLSS